MVPIKVIYNNEVRRFQFDVPQHGSLANLMQKLATVFHEHPIQWSNISVAWKDREGDRITVTTDDELKEAMRNQDADALKLFLFAKGSETNPSEASTKPKPNAAQEPGVHPGVTCDSCGGQVVGKRYKCTTCPDYDLCETCEAKNVHNVHPMIRIAVAVDGEAWKHACRGGPWRRGWGHCGRGRGRGHQIPPEWQNLAKDFMRHCRTSDATAAGEKATDTGASADAQAGDDQGAAFLHQVGDIVTNFLESFGIPVDVDVEEPPTKKSAPADQTSTNQGINTQQDPNIPLAVNTLLAMGFTNEGGWLTQLVEAKKGNISAVLDALQAKKK